MLRNRQFILFVSVFFIFIFGQNFVSEFRSVFAQETASEPISFFLDIQSERADVLAGPDSQYYSTGQLFKGNKAEVFLRDDNGWCAIRPPQNSFSWINARFVKPGQNNEGTVVCESGKKAPVRVGHSSLLKSSVVQAGLNNGDTVFLLGQLTTKDNPPTRWFRIRPPQGEYRWIHESHFEKDVCDQLPAELTLPDEYFEKQKSGTLRLRSNSNNIGSAENKSPSGLPKTEQSETGQSENRQSENGLPENGQLRAGQTQNAQADNIGDLVSNGEESVPPLPTNRKKIVNPDSDEIQILANELARPEPPSNINPNSEETGRFALIPISGNEIDDLRNQTFHIELARLERDIYDAAVNQTGADQLIFLANRCETMFLAAQNDSERSRVKRTFDSFLRISAGNRLFQTTNVARNVGAWTPPISAAYPPASNPPTSSFSASNPANSVNSSNSAASLLPGDPSSQFSLNESSSVNGQQSNRSNIPGSDRKKERLQWAFADWDWNAGSSGQKNSIARNGAVQKNVLQNNTAQNTAQNNQIRTADNSSGFLGMRTADRRPAQAFSQNNSAAINRTEEIDVQGNRNAPIQSPSMNGLHRFDRRPSSKFGNDGTGNMLETSGISGSERGSGNQNTPYLPGQIPNSSNNIRPNTANYPSYPSQNTSENISGFPVSGQVSRQAAGQTVSSIAPILQLQESDAESPRRFNGAGQYGTANIASSNPALINSTPANPANTYNSAVNSSEKTSRNWTFGSRIQPNYPRQTAQQNQVSPLGQPQLASRPSVPTLKNGAIAPPSYYEGFENRQNTPTNSGNQSSAPTGSNNSGFNNSGAGNSSSNNFSSNNISSNNFGSNNFKTSSSDGLNNLMSPGHSGFNPRLTAHNPANQGINPREKNADNQTAFLDGTGNRLNISNISNNHSSFRQAVPLLNHSPLLTDMFQASNISALPSETAWNLNSTDSDHVNSKRIPENLRLLEQNNLESGNLEHINTAQKNLKPTHIAQNDPKQIIFASNDSKQTIFTQNGANSPTKNAQTIVLDGFQNNVQLTSADSVGTSADCLLSESSGKIRLTSGTSDVIFVEKPRSLPTSVRSQKMSANSSTTSSNNQTSNNNQTLKNQNLNQNRSLNDVQTSNPMQTNAKAQALKSTQTTNQSQISDKNRTSNAAQSFDKTGVLGRFENPPPGFPPYALTSDEDGVKKIICYITPDSGLALRSYIGRKIGVNGSSGWFQSADKTLQPHLNAQSVFLLESDK